MNVETEDDLDMRVELIAQQENEEFARVMAQQEVDDGEDERALMSDWSSSVRPGGWPSSLSS